MIYEVYTTKNILDTTHVRYQETEIEKWTTCIFLKSVNFSNDSFTSKSLKYGNLFHKLLIVTCNF